MKYFTVNEPGLRKRGFTIGEYSFEIVNFKMPYIGDQYRQRNYVSIKKGYFPRFEIVYYTRANKNE